MNLFDAAGVAYVLLEIAREEGRLSIYRIAGRGAEPAPSEGIANLTKSALLARSFFSEFPDAMSCISSAEYYFKRDRNDVSGLNDVANRLKSDLVEALSSRKFLRIPDHRSALIDNPNAFGEAIAKAFPSATKDIAGAANCLAVDCNTAAVFHMMRAVEWGLRAFARDVGLNRVFKELNKATNKRTYIPLEFANWEKILGQLHAAIKTRIARFRRSADRQRAQEFYHGAHQEIESFKEAFRNHVMHTRREYSAEDADAIWAHVRRFLTALAGRGITD